MPKFARFAPLGREILHSLRILPWNFFAFAILPRNLTQLQEKFYTVRFCVVRCIAVFILSRRARGKFYPEICPFFSEKKIHLFPPCSCGILVVSKRVRGGKMRRAGLVFLPSRCRFHREKCPRFARKISTFTEKNLHVFREILHTPYIY